MKQRMNLDMRFSRGPSMGRNPPPMANGQENYPAAVWAHVDGVDSPLESSTALVSFERRHNGGDFSLRVVRLEEIRSGFDDRLPTLVFSGAGKDHWLSGEISQDVTQLGRPDLRYGSVVILSSGEVASVAMYRRAPRHAQVLGAWQVPGAAGVMYVTTSPDADLGEPPFESASSEPDEPEARLDLESAEVEEVADAPDEDDEVEAADGPVKPDGYRQPYCGGGDPDDKG